MRREEVEEAEERGTYISLLLAQLGGEPLEVELPCRGIIP